MTVWTEERRAAQAEWIRRTRPWEKSTGPRTDEGKQASSRNALKHGTHATGMAEAYRLVALAREFRLLAVRMGFDDDLLRLAAKRTERGMLQNQGVEGQKEISDTAN